MEYCSIFWACFLGTQTGIPAPKIPWIWHWLSVIACKSIVMKQEYVLNLKHGLILMLKVLFTSQQTSVLFKACVCYFLSKFFDQMIRFQKLWEMFFISSKKLFSFLRYSNFHNFSLPFHTFQIQNGKCKWNNLWCHNLICINLQM